MSDLDAKALLNQGTTALRNGDDVNAERLLLQAKERLGDVSPAMAGRVWRELGIVLRRRGKLQEAAAALEHSADDFRNSENRTDDLADALMSLGNALTEMGDYPRAERAYVEALSLFDQLSAARYVTDAEDEVRCIMNYAVLLRRRKRPAEACRLLTNAFLRMSQDEAETTYALRGLMFRLIANLANCCHDLGQHDEALSWAQEGQALLNALTVEYSQEWDRDSREWERNQATLTRNKAIFAALCGQRSTAGELHRESVTSNKRLYEENAFRYGSDYAQALLDQAHFLRKEGRLTVAEPLALEALDVTRNRLSVRGAHACEDWFAAAKIILRLRLDTDGVVINNKTPVRNEP